MEYDKNKTCCFIGHRKINETDRLKSNLKSAIIDLIVNKGVCTFLFGSKSAFNDLCFEIVSEIKIDYPNIQRIYVRAEFPYINDDYRAYLLEKYEEHPYWKEKERKKIAKKIAAELDRTGSDLIKIGGRRFFVKDRKTIFGILMNLGIDSIDSVHVIKL